MLPFFLLLCWNQSSKLKIAGAEHLWLIQWYFPVGFLAKVGVLVGSVWLNSLHETCIYPYLYGKNQDFSLISLVSFFFKVEREDDILLYY